MYSHDTTMSKPLDQLKCVKKEWIIYLDKRNENEYKRFYSDRFLILVLLKGNVVCVPVYNLRVSNKKYFFHFIFQVYLRCFTWAIRITDEHFTNDGQND